MSERKKFFRVTDRREDRIRTCVHILRLKNKVRTYQQITIVNDQPIRVTTEIFRSFMEIKCRLMEPTTPRHDLPSNKPTDHKQVPIYYENEDEVFVVN